MLRRLRNVCVNSKTLASSSSPCQRRRILFFSEQNSVLMNAQQQRGFASNVWVSSYDLGKLVKTRPRAGEVPCETKATIPKLYWNASQLFPRVQDNSEENDDSEEDDDKEPRRRHTLLTTGEPVGSQFSRQFDEHAKRHGYKSTQWITPYDAKQRDLFQLPGNKANAIAATFFQRFFNVEQLEDAEAATRHQLRGEDKGGFAVEAQKQLKDRQKQMNFPLGVWFHESSLAEMQLKIRQGEKPVILRTKLPKKRFATSRDVFYNAEQLVNYRDLLQQNLGQSTVSSHTWLTSGLGVTQKADLEAISEATSTRAFSSKYWIRGYEVAERGFELARDAEPIGNVVEHRYFNVAQLTDQNSAFQKIGTMAS